MTATVCRQCSAQTSLLRLERVEGEDAGIRVAIAHLPVLDCANGHKRFLHPEFPLDFIKELLASAALADVTPSIEKGLFRKRLHCPSCGQELPAEAQSSHDGQARVEIPGEEPVAVELTVPLYRCSGCNHESSFTRSGMERAVMQAVANAFSSAKIPPG
jgi:hypothetical protein